MLPQIIRQSCRVHISQRNSHGIQASLCTHFANSLTFSTKSKSTTTHSNSKSPEGFRPRRTSPTSYRPQTPRKNKLNKSLLFDKSPDAKNSNELVDTFPQGIHEAMRQLKRDRARGSAPDAEYMLRYADYFTAKPGTTEEKMLHRRIMSEAFQDEKEKKQFFEMLENYVEEEKRRDFQLGMEKLEPKKLSAKEALTQSINVGDDPRSEVPSRASWSETVVRMDRVQKVQRGGTMVRYRCLIIGGNLRGVAGFGIGKAAEPKEATEAASRMCKRNIFFVDAYNKSGLTTDLVGKHNSCIVRLRSVPSNRGLKGHPLIRDILLYFGITDCSAKSHGNRNIYNVVYATFKAIMKHRSIEEIARARGKRFLGLDKAKRISLK